MLSRQQRSVFPSLPLPCLVWKRKGAKGEGEGHQVCAAAPALNPVLSISIAAKRRLRCSPPFPAPGWRCYGRVSAKAQIVAEARRFSLLQPTPHSTTDEK
jgi:hypothetical protein